MVVSQRNLIALLHDGPKLYFGGGGRRVAKWSAAARLLADSAARGATYVDLRLPERPVAGGVAASDPEDSTSSVG
jgi:cell division protein FtsQ